MACRLPGSIDSPEQLWDALLRGEDLVTEVPPDRWDADEYYDPEPGTPGRSVSKWGAFLDDVAGFDAEFFGINDREATALDPQHRLLLETSWEAMEHAGLTPDQLNESLTGVFVGLTHYDYQLVTAGSHAMEKPYGFQGNIFSMASGRIAYALGLRGPALTVDTACSSSMTAVHMACRSLNDGECDMAFAGGAFVMLDPRKFVAGTAEGHLSPTGRCHAFDVNADGYVCGEASAMVLLKRLPDAQRDGDRILAVLRGTAANQDGHTVNISTPSSDAQTAVYRAALQNAGVDPATIAMVEAHGTGTPVGDPSEYASLSEVYGIEGPCALASVKTNLGHTQSAAGVLGLIKAILAIDHGTVPRNLHFTRLPDELTGIDTQLFVPQQNTPWPTNGHAPRRAAVSSYGLSGTNVHAIVEEPPQAAEADRPAEATAPAAEQLLFVLSSTSAEELRRHAGRLADWIAAHEDVDLPDLAYTLARRRARRPVRTAVIASDRQELIAALRQIAESGTETPLSTAVGRDDRGPVWVFSGQGSQWPAMGAQLLATEPVFAATVAQLEPIIARESGFSVTDAMCAPQTVTGIDRVQPTLFTIQVALAATLDAYGVRPGAVIGHSLGEAAAAVVAGALSPEDGARVICRRSKLMTRIAGAGAMASVELPAKQVLSELAVNEIKDVVVAVVASPHSTVIGGAAETVRELVTAWEQRDVMAREIAVDVASHSPQVEPILDDLATALADLNPMEPRVPYYSATQFDPRQQPMCDSGYWVDNLRNTVRFSGAVRAALEDGYRVFAELAPHPLLTHAVEQTARSLDMPLATLASMRREQDLPHGMRSLLCDLHSAGAAVDFSVLYPGGRLVDAPLPTWTHRRLWMDGEDHKASTRGGSTVSVHPLLGQHVQLPEEPERHVWQAEIGTGVLPWPAEHRVRDVAVFPGAAYCEMALAAARAVLGTASEVRDISFEQALILDEQTTVSAWGSVSSPGVIDFTVQTDQAGEQTRQATAVLHAVEHDRPQPHNTSALTAAHPRRVDGTEVRDQLAQRGVEYGAAFSGLGAVHIGEGENATILAEVAIPRDIRAQQDHYEIHPALLDACFQAVAAHPSVRALGGQALALPLGARRLRNYGGADGAQYCFVRVTNADARGVEADLDLLDEHGSVLLGVQGLRLGTAESEQDRKDRVLRERLLTVEWRLRHLPEVTHADAGTWLLISLADDMGATSLTDVLKKHGAQCITMCWPLHGDIAASSAELQKHVRENGITGVVILTGAKSSDSEDQGLLVGRGYVQHLVRITHELAETPTTPRVYVVTRNAHTVVEGDVANLEQGGLRGLTRVIGVEYPQLRPTQIDLDQSTDFEQVAHQLLSGSDEDETAWRNGEWYTARLFPTPLRPEERHTAVADHERDGMRLKIRTPGDLETLELVACDRIPPGPGQIEVAVSASSINFADVMVAFGRYPAFEGRLPELGTDFAGVVTAVGLGVTDHKVGDRVAGLCADGCWGTYLTCDARQAVTLPDGLTEGQAAAITTAHATAYHGLHDLAKIAAGDKVLIHSATGGVGQAAIAIARAAGAEIFATAGSPQRRQLLRDMGIEQVYDSRSIEFADQIRRDTAGYGVDIVLNSVTGAGQRAGVELLAHGGRFVEIGKRDIYGDTRLGLFPFRRNLAFYGVDLGLLSYGQPERFRELLNTVYRLTADGELPLPQSTHYPLADAATAIRLMSGAQHTGKLVLDIPREGRSRVVVPPANVPIFRADGAYIVTGGLGGLGLFLAEKMAAAGCGRIVVSSRSQPTLSTLQTLERMRATGADVVVECGDIAQPETAARLVALATATGLAVRGVLHLAGTVEDATLGNITDELIERNWAPKVHGAWNLHCATVEQPLDWFCSFSSAAALVGSPGQGAYAAANSWLDAFTMWRRAQGLPAIAIAWGAWGEIGRGTALAELTDVAIAPEEGGYAFEALLRHDRAYTGYAPFIGTQWLSSFAQRTPFAEEFRSAEQNTTGTRTLRAELDELPRDEWPIRLRRLISGQVSLLLRRSIDPDHPLSEYGLDSLGSLELRTRIEAETGIRITPREVAATTTIRDLADLLCEKLASTQPAAADGPAPSSGVAPVATPASAPASRSTVVPASRPTSTATPAVTAPPAQQEVLTATDDSAPNGEELQDNRLQLADHAFFTAQHATGQEQVMQVLWVYEHPIDFDGLRRFHHNLARGMLGRRIERSPLRFARHRWVADPGPSDIEIAPHPRPRTELSDWADERTQITTDPESGSGWHLAVLALTDGSTAVSLVVSHYLLDGLGLAMAIAEAVMGNTRDLGLPQPRSRTRLRAAAKDAREFTRDVPEIAHAVGAVVKLARQHRRDLATAAKSSRRARREARRERVEAPAAKAVAVRDVDDDKPIVVPGVTIYIDVVDWDARAKALGGTSDTLLAGVAAKLAERLGRRRASDGAVTLQLPRSDRTDDDTRAIALSFARVSIDPAPVTTDLRDLRATMDQELRALREAPDTSAYDVMPPAAIGIVWLTQLMPKRAVNRLTDFMFGDPDMPVFCSNLGDFGMLMCRIDGTDAEYVTTRGASNVTRQWLERAGGLMHVQSGRVGGKLGISLVAYQPGAANTKPALRDLMTRTLAEFNLAGEIL
ncbi:polyketide synthase [Mycolicibacterium agri]|nr:polyketide synthase [Mycolicibacterium agri]